MSETVEKVAKAFAECLMGDSEGWEAWEEEIKVALQSLTPSDLAALAEPMGLAVVQKKDSCRALVHEATHSHSFKLTPWDCHWYSTYYDGFEEDDEEKSEWVDNLLEVIRIKPAKESSDG